MLPILSTIVFSISPVPLLLLRDLLRLASSSPIRLLLEHAPHLPLTKILPILLTLMLLLLPKIHQELPQ
jgi:hypothetical protein